MQVLNLGDVGSGHVWSNLKQLVILLSAIMALDRRIMSPEGERMVNEKSAYANEGDNGSGWKYSSCPLATNLVIVYKDSCS